MTCCIVFISSKAHDGYSQRWGMASHLPFLGKNLGIMEILQRWLPKRRRHELSERSHDNKRWHPGTGTRPRLGQWRLRSQWIFPRNVIICQCMGSSAWYFKNQRDVTILSTRWRERRKCIQMGRFSAPRGRRSRWAISLRVVYKFRLVIICTMIKSDVAPAKCQQGTIQSKL